MAQGRARRELYEVQKTMTVTRKFWKGVFFGLVFSIPFYVWVGWALAETYYVDNSCTDTNVGSATVDGTEYDPVTPACTGGAAKYFTTIADINAAAATLAPGDSILFRKGQTWREQLTVPESGTEGNVYTFGAFGTGADPIISGADLITHGTAWSATSPVPESGGIFVADAEDGGVTDWTGVTTGGTATFAGSSASKNNGTYGYEATSDGTNNAFGYKTFDAQTDIYFRTYFKIVSGYSQPNTYINVFLALKDSDGNIGARCYLYQSNETTIVMNCNMPYGAYNSISGGNNTITQNEWHRLEVRFKVDGSVGGGQTWLDGVSLGSNFLTNTSGYEVVRSDLGFMSTINVPNSGSKLYFDDIKTDTSAVGEYAGISNPANVWEAVVTTQPYQVLYDSVWGGLPKASLAACTTDKNWFWSSNKLYVSSTSDPDTRWTSPGVTSGTRNLGIYANAKNYITIDGLSINGANLDGIQSNGTNWTVQNTSIDATGGSGGYGHGILLTGNVGISQDNTVSNINQFGIYHTGNSGIIQRNTVSGCWNGETHDEQIALGHSGGYAIAVNGTGNQILRNTVSTSSVGISPANSLDTLVAYNVVSSWGTNGIDHELGTSGHPSLIYNNIIIHNPHEGTGWNAGHGIVCQNTGTDAAIKNNIIYVTYTGTATNVQAIAFDATSLDRIVLDNNLYFVVGGGTSNIGRLDTTDYATMANWLTALDGTSFTGKDAASVNADPLFTNAAGGDFTLSLASPAIGYGTDVSLTTDYAGKTISGLVTIGAYQYNIKYPIAQDESNVASVLDCSGANWDICAFVPVTSTGTVWDRVTVYNPLATGAALRSDAAILEANFTNSIVMGGGANLDLIPVGAVGGDYNAFPNHASAPAGYTDGGHEVWATDPNFTSEATGDYSLKRGSLLMGKGDPASTQVDINGNLAGIVEPGAYEYGYDESGARLQSGRGSGRGGMGMQMH